MLHKKDETEEEFTKFVRSRRLTRQGSDPTKKGANNNDETVGVSTTKAKFDSYSRANEVAEVETIDTDKDDEKKPNETGGAVATKAKVDYYPRANEAAEVETMDTDKDDKK